MEEIQQIEILEKYRRDGYVVLEKVVSEEYLQNFESELLKLCEKQTGIQCLSIEESLKLLYEISKDRYAQTLRTLSKSLSLLKIFTEESLLKSISDLGIEYPSLPTQPVTHVTCLDLVFEGYEIGIKAHQDWPSIQGSLDSLVVWLPFQDVHLDNHPVQILPRSHKDGMRDASTENTASVIHLTKEEDAEMQDILCKKGDAVIFSTFLVHRTKTESKTRSFRLAASVRFDNMIEDSFVNRNFPCAYKRTVDRKVDFVPKHKDLQNL